MWRGLQGESPNCTAFNDEAVFNRKQVMWNAVKKGLQNSNHQEVVEIQIHSIQSKSMYGNYKKQNIAGLVLGYIEIHF